MDKIIYLHIGTHKTGTTSVQNFSVNVKDSLRELGVLYPEGMRPILQHTLPGHHLLPWELIKHPIRQNYYLKHQTTFETVWAEFLNEIASSSCQAVVLSSEEFDRMSAEEIVELKNRFSGYQVKIVAYLRRKDAYFESMYQTDVLFHKEMNDIHSYIESLPIPKEYVGFIDKWKRVFGDENVQVEGFCRSTLKEGNVIVDFYHQIGFDVQPIYEEYMQTSQAKSYANSNVTLPLQYIEAFMSLKRMGASEESLTLVRKIAHRMRHEKTPDYHFLSYEQRKNLIEETISEFKTLGLEVNEEKCFSIEAERSRLIDHKDDKGLVYLLMDIIDFIDNTRNS